MLSGFGWPWASTAEVLGFSAAVNVAEAAKKWPLAVHLLMQERHGMIREIGGTAAGES